MTYHKANKSLFFHSYSKLQERLSVEEHRTPQDAILIEDLRTAVKFTEEEHCETFATFDGLINHHEITFDLLWALIAPNTLVYHYHDFTEQAEILLARSLSYQYRDGQRFAAISCDIIRNDGRAFGLSRTGIEINEFRGARKIRDLPLFPLKHHDGRDEIMKNAISRGRRFSQLQKPSYYEISGAALREDDKGKQFQFMVRAIVCLVARI